MTPRSSTFVFAAILAAALTAGTAAAIPARTPAPKSLLYVSMVFSNEVLVYDATATDGAPIRRITNGIWIPGQVAVDAAGNLYVPNLGRYFNSQNLAVYAPGATSPTITYTADLTTPVGVAVDKRGNMFVANLCSGSCQGGGSVVEFAPGNPTPVAVLSDPLLDSIGGVAVDPHDDVFVSYSGTLGGGIAEFRRGSTKALILDLNVLVPMGMGFGPNGDLIVADDTGQQGDGVIKIFRLGVDRPVRELAPMGSLVALALNGARTRLFVADQENDVVEVYSYPQGKLLNLFSRRMQQPLGVAVFPPAPN
jgi:DNA-binding beta-propeller fold protein YncE